MDDNEYLVDLIGNIETQIGELNKFESEVLSRANTDGKPVLLQTIKAHRDKLIGLAGAAVVPADENR